MEPHRIHPDGLSPYDERLIDRLRELGRNLDPLPEDVAERARDLFGGDEPSLPEPGRRFSTAVALLSPHWWPLIIPTSWVRRAADDDDDPSA